MFIKYAGTSSLSPAYDSIEWLPLFILTLSWAGFSAEITVLPDFTPNEYLYEKHKDKGSERWEVFAWAIRDVLMKHGGFKNCSQPLSEKFRYEQFMQSKKGAVNPHKLSVSVEAQAPETDMELFSPEKREKE